tara:strand:- start:52 stop:426 length:375 start_codon:yes stop_codon:yes gene_type:complete
MKLKPRRPITTAISLVYIGLLGYALLSPAPQPTGNALAENFIAAALNHDIISHSFAFLTLGLLSCFWPTDSLTSLVLALTLAVVLELLQITTATRVFEWLDLASNCAGTSLGIYIGRRFVLPHF